MDQLLTFFPFSLFTKKGYPILVFTYQIIAKTPLPFAVSNPASQGTDNAFCLLRLFHLICILSKIFTRIDLGISLWIYYQCKGPSISNSLDINC